MHGGHGHDQASQHQDGAHRSGGHT
jgi:hypothetical protein